MPKLSIRQNELNYAALFRQPALELWNEGKRLLSGLYAAFRDSGISLSDIESTSIGNSVGGQEVSVALHSRLKFVFKFDRIELKLQNFDNDELKKVPALLTKGIDWVRSELGSDPFSLQLYTYHSHSALSTGTSQDVLKQSRVAQPAPVGSDLGSGIIYHFDLPEQKARVQLTIDHSLSVQDGIFLHMIYSTADSLVGSQELFHSGETLLDGLLEPLGLTIEN